MGAPGEFDLVPSPGSVEAGTVTFTVSNDGVIEHEVVVMRSDAASGALPAGADGSAIESGVVKPTPPTVATITTACTSSPARARR